MDHADEFHVTNSGFFVDSSLAPVLRLRRKFMSVCNVLKGIETQGLTDTRVSALWCQWAAVSKMGPTGPHHGFYKWASDALALLNDFVLKVVHSRQTARLQVWSNWTREDLASHPYQWLRPDFVPPAPYLVCKPQDSPNGSGINWSNPLSSTPIFVRRGCRIFVGKGILLFPHKPSLILWGITSHRRPVWIFHSLWEGSSMMLPWPRNPLLGDLMAGLGMRLKLSLLVCWTRPSSSPNRSCWLMASATPRCVYCDDS